MWVCRTVQFGDFLNMDCITLHHAIFSPPLAVQSDNSMAILVSLSAFVQFGEHPEFYTFPLEKCYVHNISTILS